MNDLQEIWVYLSGLPLFSLVLTLLAYEIGLRLHLWSGRQPLVNPVAVAILIVLAVLIVAEMPYETYFEGAQFIHFLLGTATVSLAVPIAQGWQLLRGRIPVLLMATLAGGAVSIASASLLGLLLNLPDALLLPLLAKSVTAPIAMGIVDGTGISPTLTAIYAVLTGILGAISVRYLLDAIGMRRWADRGFALGIAAHGIGTSRAFNVHADAGAFASIAMGLHGIAGAIFIPLLIPWLRGLLV